MPYQPGDILLNKYRIESHVGSGAFAEVYHATHLELKAPRALKVLRRDAPGLGSTEFRAYEDRFKLEAQLGAMLDHPNIVRVHDFERDGEALILVMEYCEDGSLASRLQEAQRKGERLAVDAVLQIGLEAAQGLAELHKRDVVHRDLKPSNILFDSQGRAKVGDLGLAQTPHGPSMRSLLSQAAPHPGTPGYMSPEQLDSRNYLSSSSDIYALGLVLFEALTGRAYSNLRPGTRLIDMRLDAPPWLDELLGKMLVENPKQRPWDGEEIAVLLRGGIEENARLQEVRRREEEDEQQTRLEAEAKKRSAEEEKVRLDEEERIHREAAEKARREQEDREGKGTKSFTLEEAIGIISLLGVLVIGFLISDMNRGLSSSELTPETTRSPSAFTTHTSVITTRPTNSSTPVIPELANQISDEKGVKMALIPAGEFLMGSENGESNEKPVHTVYLDDFYLDIYEVTNALYARCVQAGACSAPGVFRSNSRNTYYGNPTYEEYPVVNVNWNQASEFCEWRGARLPTEAEWEKAARGGLEGKDYPWGNEAPVCRKGAENGAKFDDDQDCNATDTEAVGSYAPNGYGLYDMAGNVREWVMDWYNKSYYNSLVDRNPTGPQNGVARVVRGGSWNLNPSYLRAASRFWSNSHAPHYGYGGFRCYRSP